MKERGEGRLVAVVGTDARQAAAGRALAAAGYRVGGAERVPEADVILLPMPLDAAQSGLTGLLRAAKPGALALGGKVSAECRAAAQRCGVRLLDYLAREELTILNAIPTAEGCIGLLLRERVRTLWGSAVLLVGYGHIGQALGPRLAALGARVTAAARRPAQRALARAAGLEAADTAALAALAPGFDTVVNTVPAPLLTAEVLAQLPARSLVVDLASRPGGTDFAAAERLGHTVRHALSLPALCAPESAGQFVAQTVREMLAEERGEDL